MSITYEDVISGILCIRDETKLRNLNHLVVEQIRAATAVKESKLRFEFTSGQRVRFAGRRGRPLTGKILTMGPKKAVVLTDAMESWRVPYSMLEEV
jgi:hypothetical protein